MIASDMTAVAAIRREINEMRLVREAYARYAREAVALGRDPRRENRNVARADRTLARLEGALAEAEGSAR